MSAVRIAVEQLVSGRDAKEVIADMWKTYTTLQSMDNKMSIVRMAIKSGGHYAKEYKQTVQPLCAFVQDEPDILTFLQSSLKDQCAIQKAHKIDPVWSKEAEDALQHVVLLPQNLRDFKLSDAESVRLKR